MAVAVGSTVRSNNGLANKDVELVGLQKQHGPIGPKADMFIEGIQPHKKGATHASVNEERKRLETGIQIVRSTFEKQVESVSFGAGDHQVYRTFLTIETRLEDEEV